MKSNLKNFAQNRRRQIQACLFLSFFCFVLLVSCSNKKTIDEVLSSAADNAAAAARYALTNGADFTTNSQRLAQADKIASGVKMAVTNEIFAGVIESGAVLQQLLNWGRLPGVSQGEHGEINCDLVDAVVSNKVVVMDYPASRTWHLVKIDETFTNNYVLVKQTKDSEWKLQKAWQTDANGQTIKEWPVQK